MGKVYHRPQGVPLGIKPKEWFETKKYLDRQEKHRKLGNHLIHFFTDLIDFVHFGIKKDPVR